MSVIISILIAAVVLLLAAAVGFILQRMIFKKQFPLFMFLFLILPAGQIFMLYSFQFKTWTVYWLLGLVLNLLADALLLGYTVSRERKSAAEEELKEVEHRIALEKSHYDAVEKRREQLEKIRLDFHNRLNLAMNLEAGSDASARNMIVSMSDQINQTRENIYCGIPVVNAILTEKEEVCQQAEIDLQISLDIPALPWVEQMHLCSIFSNLLDNAITACKQMENKAPLMIQLSSMVAGDYLFIKVTNPSNKPRHKPIAGRGYGFRILSDLAERYGGSFQSHYNNGIFTAVVSLLAAENMESG
ncbi:MAG: GHKL domain-containing protein [Hungatella sp.]|jgi:signal transduction histidine kinase|nr:GHKL domain-containing protein [Hungatella sp.]